MKIVKASTPSDPRFISTGLLSLAGWDTMLLIHISGISVGSHSHCEQPHWHHSPTWPAIVL